MMKYLSLFLAAAPSSILIAQLARTQRLRVALIEAAQIVGIVGIAMLTDWLLLNLGIHQLQQRLDQKASQQSQPWLSLGASLLRLTLRILLWALVLSWILQSVQSLSPWHERIDSTIQFLLKRVAVVFNTPFMELGRTQITLNFLFLILFLSLAVIFTSRWVSEWLKSRILMQLRVDRGSQETITRVVSYSLSFIGFIVVLQTAGIDLSSLTVLAGVLGIGFGFGLQTLASNFISGLAILLEHPIKVGDFIEVDGLLGTVEKISIRATIIRTNDSQYVIVPNNRFIEKNVVNWSYGSPDSRIHIPVSVAYGSDTVLVTEALLSAARQDPRVLLTPPPSVWFRGFGENAYLFELLVWINRPQDSEPIKSALNFLIEQELRQRQIEVPFPQLDLRLRDLGELRSLAHYYHRSVASVPETAAVSEPVAPEMVKTEPSLADLLRNISCFSRCSNAELQMLIELGNRQFYGVGEIICSEGDPGDAFYIVLEGSVEVRSEQLDQILATLYEGDFFGEISVLTGMPRSATVRALEETVLFVVHRSAVQRLLQAQPQLAEEIAHELAARQQVLQELGLVNSQEIKSLPPLQWIRRRLQTLFNV
ncbi:MULTISPECIES: mechanosensitive ion channel domain-containing protein [unclassified Thermosynechococcus]|uniref:mechanosensitive ion channel domain-containing protein n=1 Tax=unclassified Thermosynechococcus TaxID=2622553 RepID=UPI00197D8F49|nr:MULTISPECIES: mechanosensitive ion channel domain-containing protein [unclassified Thermosynechococcus]QSF50193.1 mechanosensitive ion channel [Thermosynechococcus sp. TA-1]WNC33547.1 mechanosensitive ion channel [Thermosynechococcus sp. PKX95]WNC36069.1 mechanosensitive ion channel [Thermosynechococcus sp. PKX91]WNC38594.1 mechanosensitive ion channel [Thermosynechococcus sp. WL11]WNC41113.1 mechanosensitive ion channel [Thermosynechococcus sp. WL17]